MSKQFLHYNEKNEALDKCCKLDLKKTLPNEQIALITYASFSAARYALLIKIHPNEQYTSVRKSSAPVAHGFKTLITSQLKMSVYAKMFLATIFAVKNFRHLFWRLTKLVNILTEKIV